MFVSFSIILLLSYFNNHFYYTSLFLHISLAGHHAVVGSMFNEFDFNSDFHLESLELNTVDQIVIDVSRHSRACRLSDLLAFYDTDRDNLLSQDEIFVAFGNSLSRSLIWLIGFYGNPVLTASFGLIHMRRPHITTVLLLKLDNQKLYYNVMQFIISFFSTNEN